MPAELRAKLHVQTRFGWHSTSPLTLDELQGRRADIVELMCSDALQEDLGAVERFQAVLAHGSKMRLLCDQQGPLVTILRGQTFAVMRQEEYVGTMPPPPATRLVETH